MYVSARIWMPDGKGVQRAYEVGACVTKDDGRYTVDEPDVSGPNGTLRTSRIYPNPQIPGVLAYGWSTRVCDLLISTYRDAEERGEVDDSVTDYPAEDDYGP